jgi:hypothetical protein
MNYHDTLIEVAEDCPVREAQVPQARGAKKTKAVVEYEQLVKYPYKYALWSWYAAVLPSVTSRPSTESGAAGNRHGTSRLDSSRLLLKSSAR